MALIRMGGASDEDIRKQLEARIGSQGDLGRKRFIQKKPS